MVRVDVIMRAARGQTNYMIAKQLGISRNTVKLWRYRFAREGTTGLITRPISGRPPKHLDRQKSPLDVGKPSA
jgi:transposase